MTAAPPLTVATLNLRYGTAKDGSNAWEHRRGLAAEVIRGLDADVLCLQECMLFQSDFLHGALSGFQSVGVSREDGRRSGGEMVPVWWRADRLELIDAGHFWLSPEPQLPGALGWDASLPRMATWAALRFVGSPRAVFTVFSTHFDYQGGHARQESAALVRRRTAGRGPAMPVIVAGDFNATEFDPAYRILREDRLDPGDGLGDAYRVAHPDPEPGEGTYHDFTGRTDGKRIDWIMVSPHWRVLDCRIDHTSRDGRYPSDHFPVVARLELAAGS